MFFFQDLLYVKWNDVLYFMVKLDIMFLKTKIPKTEYFKRKVKVESFAVKHHQN